MCLYCTEYAHVDLDRFEPSGADGNWFKVGCSRYGDVTMRRGRLQSKCVRDFLRCLYSCHDNNDRPI